MHDAYPRRAVMQYNHFTGHEKARIFNGGQGPEGDRFYQPTEKRGLMADSRLMRNVSIVGTSSLKQFSVDQPEWAGYSMYEPWACAVSQALEDANIRPNDVEKISYSQFAYFPTMGHICAPVNYLEEWAGLAGKPISHIEQACASGYIAFTEAVQAIASGEYDVVLVAGLECPKFFVPIDEPAYRVKPLSEYKEFWHPGVALFDCGHARFDGASDILLPDENGFYYKEFYGLKDEAFIDEAYAHMAINQRRGAVRNPRSLDYGTSKDYSEVAAAEGFASDVEYLLSPKNYKITQFTRKAGAVMHNCAAGALVLMSDEAIKKYGVQNRPIRVIDYAAASLSPRKPWCFHNMNVEVRKQLDKNGFFKPEEMDLLITTCMSSGEQTDSAEVFGYIPEGQGLQYEIDHRTAFDGDTPINPHGGDCQWGHAMGCSGVNMISEAVFQMRGTAGDSQVQKDIKKTLVRGMGGGHTTVGIILQNA